MARTYVQTRHRSIFVSILKDTASRPLASTDFPITYIQGVYSKVPVLPLHRLAIKKPKVPKSHKKQSVPFLSH